jgi:hypothetical protein
MSLPHHQGLTALYRLVLGIVTMDLKLSTLQIQINAKKPYQHQADHCWQALSSDPH